MAENDILQILRTKPFVIVHSTKRCLVRTPDILDLSISKFHDHNSPDQRFPSFSHRSSFTHNYCEAHRPATMTTFSNEKKRVQWNTHVKVRCFSPPTAAHNHAKWYQKEDYVEFRKDRCITKKLVKDLGLAYVESSGLACTHGLETMLSKHRFMEKRARVEIGLDVVLAEQVHQHANNTFCSEAIAIAYRKVSKVCHSDAHKRAISMQEKPGEPACPTKSIQKSDETRRSRMLESLRETLSAKRRLSSVRSRRPTVGTAA